MYAKMVLGWKAKRWIRRLEWGGEMDAILVYAAFWLKQHKIPFEWGFLQTPCLRRHCWKFATKGPSPTTIEIPMTAEQQACLWFLFCDLPNIQLADWYPGKSVRIQVACGPNPQISYTRQLTFPDNWFTMWPLPTLSGTVHTQSRPIFCIE